MKKNKRPIAYIVICLVFLVLVFIKIGVIVKNQKSVVVSQITEWQEIGRPVEVEVLKKADFSQYSKITARTIGSRYLESFVSNNLWSNIKDGQPFSGNYAEQELKGVVQSVGNSLDLATGLYLITLKLDSEIKASKDAIIPVMVRVSNLKNVFSVNNEAIIEKDSKKFVWLVKDKKAQLVEVNTSSDNGDRTMISNISEGEQIIYRGQSNLTEGDLVNVVNCVGCR